MTEGTAFTLHPEHLGLHLSTRRVWLHARVSLMLERLTVEFPGSLYDVLDDQGTRLRIPDSTSDFATPNDSVGAPAGAPGCIVVYGQEAAARFGDTYPDMRRRPHAGPGEAVAFELDGSQLGRDAFGFTRVTADVMHAIDRALASAVTARCTVLDGEGIPVPQRRSGGSDRIEPLNSEPVCVINGFQPQYLAFADRRAAEAFGRLFPGMRRYALADLERTWRAARMP